MANRRTLHRKISLNTELAEMSPLACLCFTWGIVHADDWGVLYGEPRIFKGAVLPLRDETTTEVANALDSLVEAELLYRWEENGRVYLWYPTFDDHQEGLGRRTRSRTEFPLPPCHPLRDSESFPEVPGNSHLARARRSEVKGSEVKRTHTSRARTRGDSDASQAASEPGPQGVCAGSANAGDGTAAADGETLRPDSETIATQGGTVDAQAETLAAAATSRRRPRLSLAPADHPQLWTALEGAYPHKRESARKALLSAFVRLLAQPGCRVTETQLASCMEADPPLAGGTPDQYMLHAQGVVAGRDGGARSRAGPAPADEGPTQPLAAEVLAAQGVADVTEEEVEEAAVRGRAVLAGFLGRRTTGEDGE